MVRFVPSVLGCLVLIAAFALSSGILTVLGGVLVAGGVLWFLASGTTTQPERRSQG